jgi:hypothetical protein
MNMAAALFLVYLKKAGGRADDCFDAWAAAANLSKPPPRFPDPFSEIVDAYTSVKLSNVTSTASEDTLIKRFEVIIKAGFNPVGKAGSCSLWNRFVQSNQSLSPIHWRAVDRLIHAHPPLAATIFTRSLTPFAAVMELASPLLLMTGSQFKWPGANINLWKEDGPSGTAVLSKLSTLIAIAGKTLLDAGLDVHGADAHGNTLSHHVVTGHDFTNLNEPYLPTKQLLFLLDAGADFNVRNDKGLSVIEFIEKYAWVNKNGHAAVCQKHRTITHCAGLESGVTRGRSTSHHRL